MMNLTKTNMNEQEKEELELLSRRMNNEVNFPEADTKRYLELMEKSAKALDESREHKKLLDEVHNTISEIENEDETIDALEKAMNFYCGTWDKCEGFKHALLLTLEDQYSNHESEQDPEDLKKLLDILTGKDN